MTLTFTIPVRTKSAANLREHWAVKAKRVVSERQITRLAFPSGVSIFLPAAIRLVRVSPRPLDDDNLRPALKAVRDELARIVGVDDRDPRVDWLYGQMKGKAAVHVIVEHGPGTHVAANCDQPRCPQHWRAS